jgi:L-ornithine N5-monooxygenase
MREGQPIELLGVGFGPANIALAAAIADHQEAAPNGHGPLRALFVDQAEDSSWQPELLFPGTDIQHHFLRDLATPRNPRSRFTFTNFLWEQGRLYDFGSWYGAPGRIEWSEYVEWVARETCQPVRYGHRVESVDLADGSCWRVRGRSLAADEPAEWLARNLVLATGQLPFVPAVFEPHLGDRVFHSQHFLHRVRDLAAGAVRRFVVVGGAQTAAEILLYLLDAFPHSECHALTRGAGFRLADFSPFTNQLYTPAGSEYFYRLPAGARELVFQELKHSNYSVIDLDAGIGLFRRMYESALTGRPRLHLSRWTEVVELSETSGGHRLRLRDVNTCEPRDLEADCIVLCTGLREERFPALLRGVEPLLLRDPDGELDVSRRYRAATVPQVTAGLYLHGMTEWRHGINNSTAFSIIALRARDILVDVLDRAGEPISSPAVREG